MSPRYRRFLRVESAPVRPFIISRHAPACQQYRPLTISVSHTTPSTATLRPRSNYRGCRRAPVEAGKLLSFSFAGADLSGKRFLFGLAAIRADRLLPRTIPINISISSFLLLGNRPALFSPRLLIDYYVRQTRGRWTARVVAILECSCE